MPAFFARLLPHRPDFVATMTAEERQVMAAHSAFLKGELEAGRMVVAGPVVDPVQPFGMAVFEAESLEALRARLAQDPANAIGRYELFPMAGLIARPHRP